MVLCETIMDDSIDFGNFSIRGSERFSYSYEWSCSLWERGASFYKELISRKLPAFLFMFSTDFTSFSVLFFFPLSITFIFMSMFDTVLSNINEVISINISANGFVFGDFNVCHRDWITGSGGTDSPGNVKLRRSGG